MLSVGTLFGFLPMAASEFLHRGLIRHNIRELPLMRRTVLTAVDLPEIHNEPFDRMLVVQALSEELTIITHDRKFAHYPVEVFWT